MNLLEKENIDPEDIIPTSLSQERHMLETMEASAQALHARIQYLLKEESKGRKQMESVFQSSLAAVERKVGACEQQRQLQNMYATRDKGAQHLQLKVKQLKEQQRSQFLAAKQSLGELRKEQCQNIRQMSRKNRQLIDDSRKHFMDLKHQHISLTKQGRHQHRSELERLAEQKRQQLIKAKLQEHNRNEERKKQLLEQIKKMEQTEHELLGRIKKTSNNSAQFANLRKTANNMTVSEFETVIHQVESSEKEAVKLGRANQKILEYLLKSMPSSKTQDTSSREMSQHKV